MKDYCILGVLAISLTLCVSNSASAKIWRVNNVAGTDADFTTVQAAHDAAADGDTIYLEPSITSYGNLSMNHRLTIISTGNFIDVNPNLQASLTPGSMGSISMTAGAAGSVIQCNTSSISISNADNVRVQNTRATSTISIANSDNVIVLNCFLTAVAVSSSSNAIISNCILTSFISVNSSSSATISNNVLNAGVASSATMYNSAFQNNIINKTANHTFTNCTVLNNLASSATGLPVGNGNVNSVNMANVFVNAAGDDDVSFVLKVGGNPATGAGVGGVDCGAFGGSTPYVMGLQPAIPGIYKLVVPASANGNTMNIIFSTRSNN